MLSVQAFLYGKQITYTLKFLNSFARRQHLFDIVATPIYVDSNILSYFAVCTLVPVSISPKI